MRIFKINSINIGDRYKNTQGSWSTIITFTNTVNVTIKFDTGFITTVQFASIEAGNVKDFLFPHVFATGYRGVGKYMPTTNGIANKSYTIWGKMIRRCYSKRFLSEHPSYIGCSVCSEWLNYQNFAKWYSEQHSENNWQLDKDIIHIGNKEYSPLNCCFLPAEVNSLLIDRKALRGDYKQGVNFSKNRFMAKVSIGRVIKRLGSFKTEDEAFAAYKKAKEENVKRVAEKYKGIVDNRAYESLMNYSL